MAFQVGAYTEQISLDRKMGLCYDIFYTTYPSDISMQRLVIMGSEV